MAISKKFEAQVLALNTKGKAAAEALQALGAEAVRKAYSNQDAEWATFLLGNLPSYMRDPLSRWFRKAGLNIVGDQCTGAIDSKAQNRAFKFIESTPVLVCDAPVRAEKEEKALEGTGEERARELLAKAVKRLKKDDPDAAEALNNIAARPATPARSVLVSNDGIVFSLNVEETDTLVEFLQTLRAPKVEKAKPASPAKLQQLQQKHAA